MAASLPSFRFGLRSKIIALFIIFSMLISLAVSYSLAQIVNARLLNELKAQLKTTVSLGAASLDQAALVRLAELSTNYDNTTLGQGDVTGIEKSEDFALISRQLNNIRATNPAIIRFVYTFAPSQKPELARFLVDADVLELLSKESANPSEESEISHFASDFDIREYELAQKTLREKSVNIDSVYVYDEVYKLNSISGYAPIVDTKGKLIAVLGLDMADSDVRTTLSEISTLSAIITVLAILASLLISLILGTVLTRNVLKLQKTVESFGQEDFSARSDVKSKDEIGALALSFNTMAQTIIDYQVRIGKAEREKAEAEFRGQVEAARNAENSKYLDNIPQGLLLMNEARIISPQSSAFLRTLFCLDQNPAGMDLLDLVYPDPEVSEQDRHELEEFIQILVNNKHADDEMLDSINPFKERELSTRDGSIIVVSAVFKRVAMDDTGSNIMAVFEDRTSLIEAKRRHEAEAVRYETELEAIAAILHNGPVLFHDFLSDTQTLLEDFAGEQFETLDEDKTAHYFRLFHSLKGTARALDLHKIAQEAHKIEDELANNRNNDTITAALGRLDEAIRSIASTVERFESFGKQNTTGQEQTELDVFIKSLVKMTQKLGEELDKKIELKPRIELTNLPHLKELKNPLIHLVRNAVDHGIEDSFERLAAGKAEIASIELSIRKEDNMTILEISDDGQGIDFKAVRRSAIKKGMLAEDAEVSKAELLKILFKPGFSSRDKISEISGRGVGLDAVASTLKQIQGAIRISTKAGKGTSFIISLINKS